MGAGAPVALGADLVGGGGQRLAGRQVAVQQGGRLPVEAADAGFEAGFGGPDDLEAEHLTPPGSVLTDRVDAGAPAEVLEPLGHRRGLDRTEGS